MNSDDRFSFLLTALLAAGVLLFASQMKAPRAPGLPDPPRLGAVAAREPVGPGFVEEAVPPDSGPSPVAEAVLATIRSRPWPAFATTVVLHPLGDTQLPASGLELGSPYHLVIAPDGSAAWTARGESGSPSHPAGMPLAQASQALHVAVLDAGRITPEAAAAATAVWREAARRLGGAAVLFADEAAGSTITPPPGFDRAALVAAQETRRAATRPESAASKPAGERVSIRFGTGRVDAGVASTANARATGLMGRTSLASDEGLLFLYKTPDHRSFWMKGTLIPLDILYVSDDGVVLAVRTMRPPDPRTPEADLDRFVSPAACRIVLEVAGGHASARGVGVGSRLGLPVSVGLLLERAEP